MEQKPYVDSAVEALILASPEPIGVHRLCQVLTDIKPSGVVESVTRLNGRYADAGSSFRIRELAGGYQFYILPEYVGYVEELFTRRRTLRLTRAALETSAIVAYRQPVTRAEIEHIRGVASDGVIQNLLEKNMITITGRAKTVGKPLQYGTTDEFLKFFGLKALEDLPKMSEIEELISRSESKWQTRLDLERAMPVTDEEPKLNVADGTFDPGRRQEMFESGVQSVAERTPPLPGSLVLKSPAPDKSVPADVDETDETPGARDVAATSGTEEPG
jgi:segregation and condensation protein B